MDKDQEYEFYHIDKSEYDRLTYVISEADFNTGCPNPNRIDKIASEINNYLIHRRKQRTLM